MATIPAAFTKEQRVWAKSFAHLAEAEPETLAYHLTEAGLLDKAAGYWLRAGKIAVARYANLEAIAHLRRGIEALSGFADGASKDRLELDLQFALGPCLLAAEGPRSAATAATVTRARELCDADPVCRPTRKTCSKSRWRSRKAKKPDRSNCALPQTSPGSTATRAALPKPATSSRRSTTGSPRASTHKTSKKQRPCSKNYPDWSIAYDIVTQQHGGTIEVDSRVGEFTEFTIRLPRPPAGGTV